MDFKQLEVFVCVAETGSFTVASKMLFLTQPTVSAHIKALEKELNLMLITRTTKSFVLTKEGSLMFGYARSLLELRRKMIEDVSGYKGTELSVGASSVPAAYVLPDLLLRFQSSYPGTSFHILRSDSMDVIEKVKNGELDIGLAGAFTNTKDCVFEPFFRDELVIVTADNDYFRTLKQNGAGLEELLREPFVAREKSSGTRRETEAILEGMNMDFNLLNIAAVINDAETVKKSVAKGIGVTVMSRMAAEDEYAEGRLLTFSFGNEAAYRNLYIVYKKQPFRSPLEAEFINYLRKYEKAKHD